MKKTKLIIIAAVAALLLLVLGGAGVWWWHSRQQADDGDKPEQRSEVEYRYLTLDKTIVMLRNQAGDPVSHYMAVDLVFKTELPKEKTVKEHMPLLRSVTVKALSGYTMDKASTMTIEQLATDLNAAYKASYAHDRAEPPFAEAMIGKLIIE